MIPLKDARTGQMTYINKAQIVRIHEVSASTPMTLGTCRVILAAGEPVAVKGEVGALDTWIEKWGVPTNPVDELNSGVQPPWTQEPERKDHSHVNKGEAEG